MRDAVAVGLQPGCWERVTVGPGKTGRNLGAKPSSALKSGEGEGESHAARVG